MVKYNFTIYNLESRLEELKKYYYKEKDSFKKQDIVYDINLLKTVIESFYEVHNLNDRRLLDLYKDIKNIQKPYNYILEDFKDFFDLTKNNEITIPPIRYNYLSNDELMNIANDFFSYLGYPFYGYFQKIYRGRKNHIKFINRDDNNETYGNFIYLRSKKEGFLTIERNYTLEDAMTLIHEIEHNIACLINPDFISTHFCEIDTILLELLFLDFYYMKTKDSDAIYLKADYLNSAIYASDEIINLNKLEKFEKINGSFQSNKSLKTYANVICNYDPKDFETILKDYTHNKPLALIGEIYAIELYYIFQRDLNLGEYYLRKIINTHAHTNEQYYDEIKKFGGNPNQHILNYQLSLEEKVKKLSKGRKFG